LAQSAPVNQTRSALANQVHDEVVVDTAHEAPPTAHSSTELVESIIGTSADAPLCMNCGTKMRPAGSCFVCEGCGSTSGCS
jgi:ribonucleoside-diphosphate reductase alpha chain